MYGECPSDLLSVNRYVFGKKINTVLMMLNLNSKLCSMQKIITTTEKQPESLICV